MHVSVACEELTEIDSMPQQHVFALVHVEKLLLCDAED
jgi:hypothetical protein